MSGNPTKWMCGVWGVRLSGVWQGVVRRGTVCRQRQWGWDGGAHGLGEQQQHVLRIPGNRACGLCMSALLFIQFTSPVVVVWYASG